MLSNSGDAAACFHTLFLPMELPTCPSDYERAAAMRLIREFLASGVVDPYPPTA